jgi:hypothetical protein
LNDPPQLNFNSLPPQDSSISIPSIYIPPHQRTNLNEFSNEKFFEDNHAQNDDESLVNLDVNDLPIPNPVNSVGLESDEYGMENGRGLKSGVSDLDSSLSESQ